MLVKILTCKLNKLISHIFKSVFSSAKANSHVHNGIINIFKPWSLIREWALAKTKFGKHLPFALHSLFYVPVYSTNSYSFATLLLKSLPKSSRIWTPVFLFFPTYAKMLTTSGSPQCSPFTAHAFITPVPVHACRLLTLLLSPMHSSRLICTVPHSPAFLHS